LKHLNAKPYHAKPYPFPQSQEAKLKAVIERLVPYGVLQKVNGSKQLGITNICGYKKKIKLSDLLQF
jgi:hypothetical protein